MKRLIAFLVLIPLLVFAQSKEDILNNLQRGGTITAVAASPDSSYSVLMWDGDEVKLITIQRVGSAFDTLSANVINADYTYLAYPPSVDSAVVMGVDAFSATETTDTVTISGAAATDFYVISGSGGSVDQQDVLQWEALAGKLVVHRLASGASGLSYSWLRIKTD